MSDNVASLFGGPSHTPQVSSSCVAALRDLLERAEAGEVVGICCAVLHHDGLASTSTAGMVGPYSLLGAVEVAKADLMGSMRD